MNEHEYEWISRSHDNIIAASVNGLFMLWGKAWSTQFSANGYFIDCF